MKQIGIRGMDHYRNHHSAYYPRVRQKTAGCRTIPDVGCGDGSLALFLNDGTRRIVGLAEPSAMIDWALAAARVLPSKMLSAFHPMQESEGLSLPAVYDYPMMKEIRGIVKNELPGTETQYGLYCRYLLEWSAC